MTDETCNADTTDGGSCGFTAKYPDGKCGHHTDHNQPYDDRDGKLTKQREEKIAQAIEEGKSLNSAARMAGVTPQTVYNWLNRGEDQEEGVYREFFERIARAKGHGEDFYFNLALQLAKENEDHRFIASLMKQRYPDSWAEKADKPGLNDSPRAVINIPDSVTEKWQHNR